MISIGIGFVDQLIRDFDLEVGLQHLVQIGAVCRGVDKNHKFAVAHIIVFQPRPDALNLLCGIILGGSGDQQGVGSIIEVGRTGDKQFLKKIAVKFIQFL